MNLALHTGPASQWRTKWAAEVSVPPWWTPALFTAFCHLCEYEHSETLTSQTIEISWSPLGICELLFDGNPVHFTKAFPTMSLPSILAFLPHHSAGWRCVPSFSSSHVPCYLGLDEPSDSITILYEALYFPEVPWRILYPLSCISVCPTIIKTKVILHIYYLLPVFFSL